MITANGRRGSLASRCLCGVLAAGLLLVAGCGRDQDSEGGPVAGEGAFAHDVEPDDVWLPGEAPTGRESPLALPTGATGARPDVTLGPVDDAALDPSGHDSLEEIRIRCALLALGDGDSEEVERLWRRLREFSSEDDRLWRQQVAMMVELATRHETASLLGETVALHGKRVPEDGRDHPIVETHDHLARDGRRESSAAIRAAVRDATGLDPMLLAALLEREVMMTPRQWSSEGLRLVDETLRRIEASGEQHRALPALAVAERVRIQIYRQQLRLQEMIEAVDAWYERFGAQNPSEAQRVAELLSAAVETAVRHKPDAEALRTRDIEQLRQWADAMRSAPHDTDEFEEAVRGFGRWVRRE